MSIPTASTPPADREHPAPRAGATHPSAPVAVLVTGAGGQLGRDLVRVLGGSPSARGEGGLVRAAARSELDVSDPEAVDAAVAALVRDAAAVGLPPVVVNAAAYTAVDAAETDEAAAHRINAEAPGRLAAACARLGAALVHVSTDYVFAGDATAPYPEDGPVAPRSAYGRTKAAGERAVLEALPDRAYVVRTAWVYGEHGANFVRTMAALERTRETLDVVDDQRGQPTWSLDLARGLARLVSDRPAAGVYHCVSQGETTWYGLARAVFEELGADPDRVRPTTTDRFPRPAPRPAYSVLGTSRWRAAGLAPLPHWRGALHEALKEWRP